MKDALIMAAIILISATVTFFALFAVDKRLATVEPITLMAEHEGVRVYRMNDNGRYFYYTTNVNPHRINL